MSPVCGALQYTHKRNTYSTHTLTICTKLFKSFKTNCTHYNTTRNIKNNIPPKNFLGVIRMDVMLVDKYNIINNEPR